MGHSTDYPEGGDTKEFREQAVRLVLKKGCYPASRVAAVDVAQDVGGTGRRRRGEWAVLGSRQKPSTESEQELRCLRRELAEVKMERGILKNAAAYLARASLPGTC